MIRIVTPPIVELGGEDLLGRVEAVHVLRCLWWPTLPVISLVTARLTPCSIKNVPERDEEAGQPGLASPGSR